MTDPICTCGHIKEWHEHYRRGSDCGTCGRDVCPDYTPWHERPRLRLAPSMLITAVALVAGFALIGWWTGNVAFGASQCQTIRACHHDLAWAKQQRRMLEKRLALKIAPDVAYACRLGEAAFGVQASHCKRVVGCESGGDPNQVTPPYSASGYSQFEPGTWRGTPFASFSIFDPIASILAMDQIAARQGFDTSYGWAASYRCHRLSGRES